MSNPIDILLVEDNPHDAELTTRALKRLSLAIHLVHVSDGQEAVDFLLGAGSHTGRNLHNQPKVVLLDMKLPKLDGIQVLQELRKNEHTRHVPVVVLTSSREERDVVSAYGMGANSYIVKPMDFHAYLEVVGSIGSYWLKLNLTRKT